jgi:Hypothetical protein (DUF2513)
MKPTWGDLTKVRTRKKEGSRTRIVRETSCNQILVRFLLAKSPTTGLSRCDGRHLPNDAGYIDARIIKGGQGVTYETAGILRMTMAGHEYLDSVRDPKVWNKTKSVLENVGGSAALEVIKDVAAKVTAELLKPFLGGG